MVVFEMMGNSSVITYETLKQAAFNASITPLELGELKVVYRSQIASPRRYDCIRSIRDFIDVLERRDELSEDNIEFLYKLANHCHLAPLIDALSHYCIPKYTEDKLRLGNEYRDYRLSESFRENLRAPRSYPNSVANSDVPHGYTARASASVAFVGILADGKRKAIYKLLCKELGRDWRNFGRELNICEGDFDNIESQSQNLSTRIAKLLKLFEEDECNDPKEHCLLLCRALDECQRKDLRRGVEKIMSY